MESISDEHLMQRVKNGDLDALSPLFEKYHIKLYNFFLRLTRNRDISGDLTQNVFRRIISYRQSYDPQLMFRPWMYQIARNVHLKYVQGNRLQLSDFSGNEPVEQDNKSAIEEMDFETKKRTLYEALDHLDHEQREIIELSRFQGLKYQEIAEITGNSVAAIKVKVHRAMHKLREIYFELA